jgi:probable F420-dependent oxidoreductase
VRALRFGLQLSGSDTPALLERARWAEGNGFDVLLAGDHLDHGMAPLALLGGLAGATSTIRLGTLVLNADWYAPAVLAREVATLDHLSDGRVELGLGAGHAPQEYEATGRPFDPPAVRKSRLAETVEVVRALLDGHEVTYDGDHHRLRGLRTLAAAQARLPILVAGRGSSLLGHAARHADIIGLAGLGRTLPDGHSHEVRWSIETLEADLAIVRAAAGERVADVELNALVQVVRVTDDRRAAAAELAGMAPGLTVEDALATPYLALGTAGEIAEQLLAARERWGISYVAVRDGDAFAPVIARLRA